MRVLVEDPSAIQVLDLGYKVALQLLTPAAEHDLHSRRVHDARHAAATLPAGVCRVYTLDSDDWKVFEVDGI